MPAASHTGTISSGLFNIPVKLFTVTNQNKVSFNQLHSDSMSQTWFERPLPQCTVVYMERTSGGGIGNRALSE